MRVGRSRLLTSTAERPTISSVLWADSMAISVTGLPKGSVRSRL